MLYGKRRDNEGSKGFALGIIIGALVGAGTALLLAPSSGDETRRLLRRKARRLSAQGGEALHHVAEDAERTARDFARRGRRYAMRARDTAQEIIRDHA